MLYFNKRLLKNNYSVVLLFWLKMHMQRKRPGMALYSSPGAAVTNDHILTGLKQHKCLVLEIWRSEVWLGLTELESRCRQDLCGSTGHLVHPGYSPYFRDSTLIPSATLIPFILWPNIHRLQVSDVGTFATVILPTTGIQEKVRNADSKWWCLTPTPLFLVCIFGFSRNAHTAFEMRKIESLLSIWMVSLQVVACLPARTVLSS